MEPRLEPVNLRLRAWCSSRPDDLDFGSLHAAPRRSRNFGVVMLALLLSLSGFAALDSLNVLNVGVTSAVIYDSRLNRRSPVPGGASFIAGVFAVTTTFGICVVLGLTFLTHLADFELTRPLPR